MSRLRILVVDDNSDFCDSLKDLLELEGYEVLKAYGGQKAVELAQKECPNLILMDLSMPGIDGITAIRETKKACPSAAIVTISAFDQEALVQKALLAGATRQFTKPLDFISLLEYIACFKPPKVRSN